MFDFDPQSAFFAPARCRVQFHAMLNRHPVKCAISVDALEHLGRTEAPNHAAAVQLFEANSLLVAGVVEAKVRANDFEHDGYVVVYTRDLIP